MKEDNNSNIGYPFFYTILLILMSIGIFLTTVVLYYDLNVYSQPSQTVESPKKVLYTATADTVVVYGVQYTEHADTAKQRYINDIVNYAMYVSTIRFIPPSIIMSQDILETGYGKSSLARKANNHFGIKLFSNTKVHKKLKHTTNGHYALVDDLIEPCKFVKFNNVLDSYIYYGEFIGTNRYKSLYETNDYRSWSSGLKRCGYATDKNYDKKLLYLIRKHKLYRFDKQKTKA